MRYRLSGLPFLTEALHLFGGEFRKVLRRVEDRKPVFGLERNFGVCSPDDEFGDSATETDFADPGVPGRDAIGIIIDVEGCPHILMMP